MHTPKNKTGSFDLSARRLRRLEPIHDICKTCLESGIANLAYLVEHRNHAVEVLPIHGPGIGLRAKMHTRILSRRLSECLR